MDQKEIDKILKEIDSTKKEDWVWLGDIGQKEFGIEEFSIDHDKNKRISATPYYTWICTDTRVGIFVYYLDEEPVMISFRPYRKWDNQYYWISKESYEKTKEYMLTLSESDEIGYNLVEGAKKLVEAAEFIEHKQHIDWNLKSKSDET